MRIALLAAALLLAPTPGRALTFDFSLKPGGTLSADQAGAFASAAAAWAAALADDVIVSLQIGFSDSLGANVLGAALPSQGFASYNDVRSRLAADATTTTDASAVASLPASIGDAAIVLTTAQAKALGYAIAPGTRDGVIEFNSSFKFATSRDDAGGVPPDAFDLIGIAQHEIGHLLGFASNLDGRLAYTNAGKTTEGRSALDLFRFSAPGLRSYAVGEAAYFSVDGGASLVAPFSDGRRFQASHWPADFNWEGAPALLAPSIGRGQAVNITSLDILALDTVGWDRSYLMATAVPEPGSLALLAPGLAAIAAGSRRRRGAPCQASRAVPAP